MEGNLMSTLASDVEGKISKLKEKIAALKVLITEDNLILQSIAKRFFINAGVTEENIVIAENGAEAVKLVRAGNRFNVIYMDELMPIMQGPEATLQIRKLERTMKFSSIIFTCSASYQGVFPGANTFLEKPLKHETIAAFLQKVVDCPWVFGDKSEHSSKKNQENHSAQIKLNWFAKRTLEEDQDQKMEKRPKF